MNRMHIVVPVILAIAGILILALRQDHTVPQQPEKLEARGQNPESKMESTVKTGPIEENSIAQTASNLSVDTETAKGIVIAKPNIPDAIIDIQGYRDPLPTKTSTPHGDRIEIGRRYHHAVYATVDENGQVTKTEYGPAGLQVVEQQ